MRAVRPSAVLTSLGILLGVGLFGGIASATATPTGGKVEFWVTPAQSQGTGTIVITGAIGDYGKSQGHLDQNGTPTKNGTYSKLTLQTGTFEVDLAKVAQAANNASPTVNSTNCSAVASTTAPATLLDGTAGYKGIGGTVNITETFAVIAPRFTSGKDKGQCNENANPVAQYVTVYGSGTVTFS